MTSIRDALMLQKREAESKLEEGYIEREAIVKGLHSNMIKVITGPRRAGKSTLALHSAKNAGSFGYVNFDDETLAFTEDYNQIIDNVDEIYKNPSIIILDEIQNLGKWELFVNRLQRGNRNLIVTGSNAHLLSRELSTHLTGRHLETVVLPLSFREYATKERKELTESEKKVLMQRYLEDGGYPEPLSKNLNYNEYISTLFESIIYKDIVKRHSIRQYKGIENLAMFMISNSARSFSLNTLSKITSLKSIHTIEKYLKYLEEAFLIFSIRRFSFKLKEQMASEKKIYCMDNGLISAKGFRAREEKWRLLENCAAVELMRRFSLKNVYYWKSAQQDYEVDFVIHRGHTVEQLIQICLDVEDLKTREREVRGLLHASKELRCKELLIVTEDYEGGEEKEWFGMRGKIKYAPMWKWLLQK